MEDELVDLEKQYSEYSDIVDNLKLSEKELEDKRRELIISELEPTMLRLQPILTALVNNDIRGVRLSLLRKRYYIIKVKKPEITKCKYLLAQDDRNYHWDQFWIKELIQLKKDLPHLIKKLSQMLRDVKIKVSGKRWFKEILSNRIVLGDKICQYCNHKNPKDSEFCVKCGETFESDING